LSAIQVPEDTPLPQAEAGSRQRGGGSAWPRYLLGRLIAVVALVVILLLITFLVVHIVPGDPARNVVGINGSAAQVQRVRLELGLTQPLTTQFVNYLGHLAQGNLGTSFITGQPVTVMIEQRLPVTAELASLALVIVLVIGLPLGILAGALQRRGRPRAAGPLFTAGTSLGGAMPEYIVGTALIFGVALTLRLLPVQGGSSPQHIILPAITVAFAPTAVFARLVRNETSAVLGQEYIMAALSKRLPTWRLYVTHVLPNVVTSTLTLGGLILVALLGGTVVTENVFNIPGIGTEIVTAILQSDYPAIQGIILVLGLLAIVITLAIDIVLGLVDPRMLSASWSR
jgi:peptide/nickel transport system permease protein